MPLSCDCYSGCWGDHSKDWPSVDYTRERWMRCVTEEAFPYGSYVHVGNHIRLETQTLANLLRARDTLASISNEELVAEITRRGGRTLSLEYIAEVNEQRCLRWHPGGVDDWTPERWITAIVGELGEMANITKKLFRQADGMVGSDEDREALEQKEADEWADTMVYMILFALRRRISMTEAIVRVFNRKSEQLDFPERL